MSYTDVTAQHKPNMEELLKKSGVKLGRPKQKHNDHKCTDLKYTGRDLELKPVLHEELLALFKKNIDIIQGSKEP